VLVASSLPRGTAIPRGSEETSLGIQDAPRRPRNNPNSFGEPKHFWEAFRNLTANSKQLRKKQTSNKTFLGGEATTAPTHPVCHSVSSFLCFVCVCARFLYWRVFFGFWPARRTYICICIHLISPVHILCRARARTAPPTHPLPRSSGPGPAKDMYRT
jgi:hypothetical protein